jgi:hypothetical protein
MDLHLHIPHWLLWTFGGTVGIILLVLLGMAIATAFFVKAISMSIAKGLGW